MAFNEPKETAFCLCKEQIFKNKSNGEMFSTWKGSLNINDAWVTVKVSRTKKGDMMIKFFKKEAK